MNIIPFSLFFAFILVGFGIVSISPALAFIASIFGYCAFFLHLNRYSNKAKFYYALLFGFSCKLVHLFWLANPTYCGSIIWLVYFLYAFVLALPFALICLLIPKKLVPTDCFIFPSLFVLSEMLREFLFYGLPWASYNLHLSFLYPMQLAAYFGPYFISGLVLLNNFAMLYAIQKKELKGFKAAAVIIALPFLLGFLHVKWAERVKSDKGLNVAMVQPMLSTAEPLFGKMPLNLTSITSSFQNLQHLISILPKEKIDLLIFPEGSFYSSLQECVYTLDQVKQLLDHLDAHCEHYFPNLDTSFAYEKEGITYVNNAFVLQTLANFYEADVIAGLDDRWGRYHYSNSAFCFQKDRPIWQRYAKQKLVPITEYIPFEWTKKIASYWGIISAYVPGKEDQVFVGKGRYGISICYEKGFSSLQRRLKQKGANLLVTLSNEIWFPNTTLQKEQLLFAKYRAIENGLFFLNVANSEKTSVINRLGQVVASLDPIEERNKKPKILKTFVALEMHPTLYTNLGDTIPIIFSFLSVILLSARRIRQRKTVRA